MKRTPLRRTPLRPKRRSQTRVMRDGRVILGARDYERLRAKVYLEQDMLCGKCGRLLWPSEMELHHLVHRGMGGGTRDDSRNNVVGLCHACHQAETPKPEWSGVRNE